MQLLWHTTRGEVDMSGTAEDYEALAALIHTGHGTHAAASSPAAAAAGVVALREIRVSTIADQAVLITVNSDDSSLQVTGDATRLNVLADNLLACAGAEEGGHQHVEYFPEHFYLAEGSAALIINSPHGAMPNSAGHANPRPS